MFRRSLTRALTFATVLSLLMSSVALADTTIADGDGLSPYADNNMAFGAVTCNAPANKAAPVVVNRNGSGTNVFKDGSTVTVSVLAVTGAGLTATIPADANTITLPSNWGSLANNTRSSAVTSTVSLTSAVAGSGSGSVTYRATGVNASNATIERDDTMLVSWTTGTCAKTTPTITWATPSAITYGTPLSATQLNATASVAGSFVYAPAAGTVLAAGTHTLQADFTPTNTAAFNSATKSVSITVNKAEQATLTVTDMPTEAQAYDTSFTVGSAGGSGTGAVTFSATGACSNVGAVITITAGSGVCSVTATKAADDNYNSTTSAAATVDAKKAEQATLTVTDMPTEAQAYDTSFTVGSAGGSGTGAVTFSATGACSNVGAVITITAGSGVCSVTATKAADDNYNSTTSAAATVDAKKAEQATLTVTDMPTEAQAYDTSFTVGSAGGSGTGAVTFSATGACSNVGAVITITAGSGVCSVTATKAADDNYNSTTSAAATVDAKKAEQATLTVTDMPTEAQAYDTSFTVGSAGGSGTGAVTFSATGACSNVGAVITITAGSGVCSVTATKAADDNYNSTTSAAATVDAKKATATVTLSNLDQTYNGSPKFATVTTVPGGLTVMVTYDDDELPPTNAGSYAVWASVLDDNYEGSASGTLVIAKGDQTIDFGGLADKTYGDAAFSVSATSTSGLTVTFNAGPAANCSVSGTTVTLGNAGSCTVTAAQAGNSNWNPAPSVNQTFTIAKAAGSVSINNIPSSAIFGGNFTPAYTKAGDGTASTTSLTTGTCTVGSDGTVNYVAAGLCTLQASVTEGTNHLAATGSQQSFTIAKADGSVSITNLPSSPLLNSSFTPVFQKLGDGAPSSTSLTPSQCSVNTTTGAVTFIGVATCTLRANVAEGTNHLAASTTYTLRASYVFTGFERPVDNNGILNVVKAGQAVPLKFRLTDGNGAGVTTLTSVSVTVASLSCTTGTTADDLEEYAAGSSGLQNLGDGYYQFNWKTPTNYANSCKTLKLGLGDGATPYTALFQFRK